MKRFTQTNLSPGNCWQTSIACILNVDPATLPDQIKIESNTTKKMFYSNALNDYLELHHNLVYYEIYEWQFPGLRIAKPGWHTIVGTSVRTPTNNIWHCVVGRYGKIAWDPHPSRAGLVEVKHWGVIGAMTNSHRENRAWRREIECKNGLFVGCLCPICIKERE